MKVGLRGNVYLPEAFLRVAQGVNDAACDGEVDVRLNFFQQRLQRIIEAVAEQQIVDVVGRERAYGVEMALHDAVGFLVDENLTGQNVVGEVCGRLFWRLCVSANQYA